MERVDCANGMGGYSLMCLLLSSMYTAVAAVSPVLFGLLLGGRGGTNGVFSTGRLDLGEEVGLSAAAGLAEAVL